MVLSDDDVRLLRQALTDGVSFFDQLDRWLIALEAGERPTPDQIAILRGGATILRDGFASAVQIVEP
jgi:hypothetical protein